MAGSHDRLGPGSRDGERLRRLPLVRSAAERVINERMNQVLGLREGTADFDSIPLGLTSPLDPYNPASVQYIGEMPQSGLTVISSDTAYAVSGQVTVNHREQVSFTTITQAGYKPHVISITNVTPEEAQGFRVFGNNILGGIVRIYGRLDNGNYLGTIGDTVVVKTYKKM